MFLFILFRYLCLLHHRDLFTFTVVLVWCASGEVVNALAKVCGSSLAGDGVVTQGVETGT